MNTIEKTLETINNIGLSTIIILIFGVLFSIKEILSLYDSFCTRFKIETKRTLKLKLEQEMLLQHETTLKELSESLEKSNSKLDQVADKIDVLSEDVRIQKEIQNACKVNELRDRLLQMYRYYTSKVTNPSGTWNEMEADAFWNLFGDYEAKGGNGHMHTVVQPAMNKLTVIKLDELLPDNDTIGQITHSE